MTAAATPTMDSPRPRVCADCGAALTDDSSASTCARCLLQACFDGHSVYGAPEAAEAFSSTLAVPGEVFGDYELLEEIARGGMGVVFKARQRSLDRTVALKMMLPGWLSNRETVRRFRVEAEAASRLMHPGIVAIHDVGECEGQHFYSMDYIEGRDLVRRLESGPVLPEMAARWMRSVSEAIYHAHQHGILHRDLKPANVLVDIRDQPHVTDFGLAKLLDEARDLTVSGRVLGTPSFMPPEQADPARGLATVASDVYGLGAILYFLLTGKAPFEGSSMEHTIRMVLTDDPIAPSRLRAGIPRDLETICLKCLSKEPHRRYASAAELAEDLGAWSRHEPIRARPVSRPERLWFWTRRNPWLAAVSAGLVVTASVGAALQEYWLQEARRAKVIAEQLTRESRQARAVAEDLVQFMNEDLTAQLRPLGRLRLLDNVNRTVQQYYLGLPMNQIPSDPRAGKAQFYRNNAAVLREMGRLDEAKASASSAIAVLEPLFQQEATKPHWAAALAEAHAEMRNILVGANLGEARSHAQETVRYCLRASALDPNNSELWLKLVNARLELGWVLHQQGKIPEAAQEIGLAREQLTKLPDANNTLEGRVQLALSFYYQGLIHSKRGEKELAQSSFAEYLSRTTELARESGNSADKRMLHNLAIAHSHLGKALDSDEAAFKHFEEYFQLAEELERLDPGNVNYRQELGFSLAWLADSLGKTGGSPDKIAELLVRSRDCFQSLANDFPQGDVWQDEAARASTELGTWYRHHDQAELARELLAEEVNHRWSLLLQAPSHLANHRRFIRAIDWSEQERDPTSGDPTGHLKLLREWMAKVQVESSKPRSSAEWIWTRGTLHHHIADALGALGQFESAKSESELALPLWQQLAREQPEEGELAAKAAQTFSNVNVASRRAGLPGQEMKAVRPFAEWLKTRERNYHGTEEILVIAGKLYDDLAKPNTAGSPEAQATLRVFQQAIESLKSN